MWHERLKDRSTLILHIKPSKNKTEILEERDQTLIVAVNAPPIDGKANDEIERFFSKLLKKKAIINAGRNSRKKRLSLS